MSWTEEEGGGEGGGQEARGKRLIQISYDSTGRTEETTFGAEAGGWEAYFEELFERVDRKILDDDREKYQGE